ncbi:MAG TPA: hypothetical protein VJ508_04110, partial [Saprospiraceae bacterium]|nr:hypothetical protein [Saprospiraceae bacterium]
SGRYFDYYFKNYPHLFRQNRNGVALLTGKESEADLINLAADIFMYFGLGCRNVSKIFVPTGYGFKDWPAAIAEWSWMADHNKYRNNLDYNQAIYLINRIPHIGFGHLVLKEDDVVPSRIGCLHYSYFSEIGEVVRRLDEQRDQIQCIVSKDPIGHWDHIRPGQSQQPALHQYADGVDTMEFLINL